MKCLDPTDDEPSILEVLSVAFHDSIDNDVLAWTKRINSALDVVHLISFLSRLKVCIHVGLDARMVTARHRFHSTGTVAVCVFVFIDGNYT